MKDNPFKEIVGGFKSLLTGMRITIGQFLKPIVTVQYPYKTLPIPARFRGHIELVLDPASGKPKCFVCKLCERACPSDCITVDGEKFPGDKKKSLTQYRLDFTKCSLCGSCVEACRDGAIRFSRDYNMVALDKDQFVMDLFRRLENEAGGPGAFAHVPPPAVTEASPAASSGAAAPSAIAAAPPKPPGASAVEPKPAVVAATVAVAAPNLNAEVK
ncbi:MAG TPA: NADH-quinone oxidoreductase subunit I [Terriglobales bacterium]|nr:NADH-quinone oxidoreductase subunit I [Terriglobales bacterium]